MGKNDRGKALVISTWGLPTQWSKYRYTVNIEHKAFESLPKNFECESYCTTHVLTSYLLNAFDVDILVFGVDTVVDPSKAEDRIRDKAEELYRGWFQELVNKCSCCSDIDWWKISEISILPGVGRYHGWHFKASIDSMFVKAFYKIYNKMENKDYNWVFLDLTHGLNYILVTVLYATIANTIIFGKEDRLVILNSEPASRTRYDVSRQSQETMQRQTQGQDVGMLTVLDVSRLQKVISFIRGIESLKYLQPFKLGKTLKEIKEYDSRIGYLLEVQVLPFFKLLVNGIVGPTFNNSYVVDDKGVEELSPYALCRHKDEIFEGAEADADRYEFKPARVDQNQKTVEYSGANIFSVMLLALKKIVDDVCNALTAREGDKYLKKYLENIARYYSSIDNLAGKLIVDVALNDLGLVVEGTTNNIEYLRQNNLVVETVYHKPQIDKTLHIAIAQNKGVDRFKLLSQLKEVEKRIAEEISGLEGNLERFLRHMCAHAGFEYTTLEKIVIDVVRKDIVKIVYNKKLLEKLLEHGDIVPKHRQ